MTQIDKATQDSESSATPLPSDVDRLARHVEQLRDTVNACERQQKQCRTRLLKAHVAVRYLSTADFLRKKTSDIFGWRPAGVLIGTVAIAAFFVAATLSWKIGLIGIAIGAVVSYCVFYWPPDSRLAEDAPRLGDVLAALKAESDASAGNLIRLRADLATAAEKHAECSELVRTKHDRESRANRCRQLLAQDWKSFRCISLEHFLEEVVRELGYDIETSRVAGDQGADLIVSKSGRRVAIHVRGCCDGVSHDAVWEAHATKAYYKCEACAVVTNSRFTSSAKDVAGKVGCVLIDEESLPALVLGKIDV